METPEFIRSLEQSIHAAVAQRHLLAEVKNVINIDDTPNHLDPVFSFTQIAFSTLYGDKNWICATDKLYYHTGNHYKYSPDSREIKRITDFCNSFVVENEQGKKTYPYASPSSVKKVLEWAKMRTVIEAELLNPPGINCTNGIVRPVWIGKRRAHGREFFIYAVYKVQMSLHLIHDDYRLRFGIESSYRMKNQCRIKTTIKNPTIRFLFVALSFLIINIWIYLVWHYLSRLKRSSRQVLSHLFTLKQMLEFLRQAVDREYGVACEVCLPSG
jgi:hypothetical protein